MTTMYRFFMLDHISVLYVAVKIVGRMLGDDLVAFLRLLFLS